MAISGYSTTLVGTSLGALTGVERVTSGGLELRFDEVAILDAYRTGTATFTTDSDEVSGTNTAWTSAMVGRKIQLDADATECVIKSVETTTALTLTANYSDTGGSGAYTIFASAITEHIPLGVQAPPVTVTFNYNKTVYDTVEGAVTARTEDTFTLTDGESSTEIGLARVASVGDKTLSSDGHARFTCTLQPTTYLEFTDGS